MRLLPLIAAAWLASGAGAMGQTNGPGAAEAPNPPVAEPVQWFTADAGGVGSFALTWLGETLIENPPATRAWLLPSSAFNTLTVDGTGQDPLRGLDLREASSTVGPWRVHSAAGLAQAYPVPGFEWTRACALETNRGALVIVDVCRAASNHVFALHLHSSRDVADLEGGLLVFGSNACARVTSAASVESVFEITPDPVPSRAPDEAEMKAWVIAQDAWRRSNPGAVPGARWIAVQAESLERPQGVVMAVRPLAQGSALLHWSQRGQVLKGRLSVPRAGFYHLLLKYAADAPADVTVRLGGKPVFRGMKPVTFAPTGGLSDASNDWAFLVVGEHNDPEGYLFWLPEGDHELELEHGGGGTLVLDYLVFYPQGLARSGAVSAMNDDACLAMRGNRTRLTRTFAAASRVVAVTVVVPSALGKRDGPVFKRPAFLPPDASAPAEPAPPPAARVSVADELAEVELPGSPARLKIEVEGMNVTFRQVTREQVQTTVPRPRSQSPR